MIQLRVLFALSNDSPIFISKRRFKHHLASKFIYHREFLTPGSLVSPRSFFLFFTNIYEHQELDCERWIVWVRNPESTRLQLLSKRKWVGVWCVVPRIARRSRARGKRASKRRGTVELITIYLQLPELSGRRKRDERRETRARETEERTAARACVAMSLNG